MAWHTGLWPGTRRMPAHRRRDDWQTSGMRVLICPDKFAGTLTAVEAAEAIAAGWRAVAGDDELICRPVADGGPGFLEVLHAALGGELIDTPTLDPLGRPTKGQVLLVGDTAYLETAQATGLHLLAADERNPLTTTSYGVGLLLWAAVRAGARRVVLGLGGSGTNDGGAGMLEAIGFTPIDGAHTALRRGGAALADVAQLVALGGADTLTGSHLPDGDDGLPSGPGLPALGLADIELIAATDVDNPLTGLQGASAVYGPQKGATPADVSLLDKALARWAAVLEKDLRGCPPELASIPGGGAAGGLGAGVLALGGRVASGIELITELTGLGEVLDSADLVITGEGSFDHQSLRGKVISGLAGAARDRGVPCVVLAGRVTTGRREQGAAGVTDAYALVEHFGDVETALAQPARGLRELSARLAGQWSRS